MKIKEKKVKNRLQILEEKVQCSHCKVWLGNKYRLKTHFETIHGNFKLTQNYYECPECSELYLHKSNCVKHLKKHHHFQPNDLKRFKKHPKITMQANKSKLNIVQFFGVLSTVL